jgi:hypothetical protein
MAKSKQDNNTYKYKKDYDTDLEAHDKYTVEWDSLEAMLVSKTYDSISKQTKNGITDSDAATMLIERSARVVGQLPEGVTEAAGKKDRGKASLMDVVRSSYIYPNANAQRPFLEKLRLWELYSGVYGVSLMYYDWDVAPNGYIGPNCWLWNPRNFVPQKGKYSIEDMEYAHAISWITKAEIGNLLKQLKKDETFAETSGWNKSTLSEIYDAIDSFSKEQDGNRTTYNERAKQDAIKGRVQVVTRFEAGKNGRWITFAPDMGALELRNIANPHKNGYIPFVAKQSIQLMDSFYGLADLQRAKPIQFAKDGLINFYFQGLKMNLYPPTIVNSQGILKHTVSNEPGAIWEEIIPNSARRLETSTAGLSTYQAVMGQMSGAIQNVYGTTTTQANSESAMSSQFGKTPQALKIQSERESSRDNQNRSMLQTSIEQLVDRFYELIVNVGTEPFDVTLFSEDIKYIIAQGYTDVNEMVQWNESDNSGKIVIKPEALKGISYRFNMKSDSTIKITKKEQKEDLLEFISVLAKHQNELQEIYKTSGKMINWEKIINQYAALADLPGIGDVFVQGEKPEDNKPDPVMELLKAMNIQYTDLPEDVKQQVMQGLGVQTGELSPREKDIKVKETDAETRRIQALGQSTPAPEDDIDPDIGAAISQLQNML